MVVHESGEMYLETIHKLQKSGKVVRAVDVAAEMGFSKPSVSRGLSILKEHGYLIVEENGNLRLTEKGSDLAEKIFERHIIISELLIKIGVDDLTATEDACRIEHIISDETFEKIKEINERFKG